MRISDWSSDVCSSDLVVAGDARAGFDHALAERERRVGIRTAGQERRYVGRQVGVVGLEDRKSVVWGKSVSVRVDVGGRRIIKKKSKTNGKRLRNRTAKQKEKNVNKNNRKQRRK